MIEEWEWLVDLDMFTEIVDSLHHRKPFHSALRTSGLDMEDCREDNEEIYLDTPTSSKAVKKFHSAFVSVCKILLRVCLFDYLITANLIIYVEDKPYITSQRL